MNAATGDKEGGGEGEVVASEAHGSNSLECVADVVFQGIPQSNKAGLRAPPVSIFSKHCTNRVCTLVCTISLRRVSNQKHNGIKHIR